MSEYESENDTQIPEEFRQEIKEYIGFYNALKENGHVKEDEYID